MTREIQDLLKILCELQKIDPEFPLHYARCLCEIGIEEGLSVTRLSEKTALPLSTVSRIVGALSTNRQKGSPYRLIEVRISAAERRRKELFLTAEGHAVISRLSDVVSSL